MKNYYKYSLTEIFELFQSGWSGLSGDEVAKRLLQYGPNKLPDGKADSYFVIFFHQFKSSLIYILLTACIILFLMGDLADSIIIMIVLVFNSIIGTIQEGKAQNTLLALKNFTETKATVLRGEKELIILDDELVPGDILILQEGEKIPADARIIFDTNLKVDESSLTGESEPIQKIASEIKSDNLLISDQKNMVFKGTNILTGNGKAIVVATGLDTIIGNISKEISNLDTDDMPLKKNIQNLSKLIIAVVFLISFFLFIIGVSTGKTIIEMFGTVISLSVSIIPEGLPVVVTLVLATGVWRMSKRNVLVKKLQAVEALGQVKVIAVDKTGTITKNEMIVEKVYLPDKNFLTKGKYFEVGGNGYEPFGDITLDNKIIDPLNHPELILLGKTGIFCSNARVLFSEENKIWRVAGDPTEAAMLVFGQKLGFHKDNLERECPLVEEIPFDYRLKYHVTVHNCNKERILSMVGAPEEVLKLCNRVSVAGKEYYLSQKEKDYLEEIFFDMSKGGLRVIAGAIRNDFSNQLDNNSVKDLVFVGFWGIKDSLRLEVVKAMNDAQSAGIRVVMITGDNKITAQAIAIEAGIYKVGDSILIGQEIDLMSEEDLCLKLEKTSVFARVTPNHKLRIIRAYKTRGEIVAMTGDGVNDASSLVAADLGVAMGKIGTEVAKEASDIILLDDNFGSIIGAVEEGRNIYKTIQKVILYLFSTSCGEAFTIIGAILLGSPLPLLPAQIIWLNFVTDGFLVVALGMEKKEDNLLKGNFNKPKKYLVDKITSQRIFLMALSMVIGTLILFNLYLEDGIVKARTISLTVLAVFQWFNAWNCRHESKSIFKMNPFSNLYLVWSLLIIISLQLLLVYHPLMQSLFKTTALTFNDWLIILPVATSIILIEELRKFFQRHKTSLFLSKKPINISL